MVKTTSVLALVTLAATVSSSVQAADPTDKGDVLALGAIRKFVNNNTPCVASCTASPCCGEANGRLTEVRYSGLGVSGMLPADIGHATKLKVLDLSDNALYGTVPGSLAALTELKELLLNDNKLTGSVPRSLANLESSLDRLLLNGNNMKGDMTPEFAFLALNVNEVNIADNQFKAPLPTNYKFGNRNVKIDGTNTFCQIAGRVGGQDNTVPACTDDCSSYSCPASMQKRNSACIDCDNDQCCATEGVPTHETDKSVYNWLVGENGAGGGWAQLGKCTTSPCSSSPCCRMSTSSGRITEIRMNRKYLSGPLPAELAQLESLVVLDLETNDLTGTIPSGFGYLRNIYEMNLGSNKLTGPVPLSFEFLASARSTANNEGLSVVGTTRKNDVCVYSGSTIPGCADCGEASACSTPKPAAPDPLARPTPTSTGIGNGNDNNSDGGGGDFGGGGGGGNGSAASVNAGAVAGIVVASMLALLF